MQSTVLSATAVFKSLGPVSERRLVWWAFIGGGRGAGGLAPVAFPWTMILDGVEDHFP